MQVLNTNAVIAIFLGIFLQNSMVCEAQKKYEFGKGLRYLAKDSSFYMKFSVRAQTRFDAIYTETPTPDVLTGYQVKRARTKFDGFVLTPNLIYKLEFDVVEGYVRDAYVRWNFYKNVSVQYGLAKLPGNRERVVSSQKLQFVDRSLFNDAFNIDRDNGTHLIHSFNMGKSYIRETVCYTDGRGINDRTFTNGGSYTARLDFLPFGEFANNGDFFFADLEREKTPKLMLGACYNLNDNAVDEKGQNGARLKESRDLSTVFADMMFKYRGISLFGEYGTKKTLDGPALVAYDSSSTTYQSFFTGYGYNTQVAYLFKNNLEVALRYTAVIPEKNIGKNEVTEYMLGLSKYISGHNLKLQSDIAYRQSVLPAGDVDNRVIYRLQLELSF